MNFLKNYLHFFTSISTAILVVVTIDALMGDYREMPKYITLEILAAGAVTALVTTIILCREIRSRKQMCYMSILNYVILCAVMSCVGIIFDWIDPVFAGIAVMCFYVAVVYVIVFWITYIILKKDADDLNRALNERRINARKNEE